jgi:Tol biopolymer transport system component
MPIDHSIRELISLGVDLTYGEAVAIAQELITRVPTDDHVAPPFGPPSLDNVFIYPDGSVECLACGSTPAVSEIARLLDAMLPRGGKVRVPGGLRYTIARALLEVDVPPFDSLEELSAALARHETGERSDIVRELCARAAPAQPQPKVVPFHRERRRGAPSATDLRRHLRQADEALFNHAHAEQPTRVETVALPGVEALVLRQEPVDVLRQEPVDVPPTAERPAERRWLLAGAVAALIAFSAGYAAIDGINALNRRPGTVSRASSSAPSVAAPASTPASVVGLPAARPADAAPGAVASPSAAPPNSAPRPSPPSSRDALRSTPALSAASRTPAGRGASLVRAVSASSGPTFSPTFASTGTALFFHTGKSSDVRSSLEAADLNGDDLRVMTILDDGAKNYHVRPSPDGRRVAFDSDRDGERGVYVASRDGSDVHRVSEPGFAAVPTWSPDGARLAYIRAEADRPRVWNLWLQDLATGRARRLTSFAYGQTWSASWFPDGRHIGYTHEDRLIVRDLDTGSTHEYESPVSRRLMRTPAVSPDGTHVIFQVARSGAWLLDLHDGSMRCVLTDPTAEEFAWSPDGRRVAFHSRRDGQWGIWLMAPA